MSLQRQASPADEADLEATAELPVLDVMAYEAAAVASASSAMPRAAARTAPSSALIDENRARLEINLQALSTTLRDVEERLSRKGERLAEIERQLQSALAERDAAQLRARDLAQENTRTQATATAAQSRSDQLQTTLQEREAAEEARRARDSALHAQLVDRNSQLQAQLSTNHREFESRLAATRAELEASLLLSRRDVESQLAASRGEYESRFASAQRQFDEALGARAHALALLQCELAEARSRSAAYLEALQSNEGRRAVSEDLIANLEQQVATLSVALERHGAQHTDAERARDALQATVGSLEAKLQERDERVRSLSETITRLTAAAAEQRAELEAGVVERAAVVAGAASLETRLQEAQAHATEQQAAAQSALGRGVELESALAAQRQHIGQLEQQIMSVRDELQISAASLQAAVAERSMRTGQLAASEARLVELEGRIAAQQETVRLLQAESNSGAARIQQLEMELGAARQLQQQLEAQVREQGARAQELEKINDDWRATIEEARLALTERDNLIQRLEQETADSAVLVGHIQRSITRLDHGTEHTHDPAPDGATRLLIRADGDSEVVHVLGRKTTVGRTPDNDLQIDARFISRHHAVILAGPAHAIIEDLNSTNGVLVNDRRITRQPLKDGDNVMIGKTRFRFVVRTPGERR
ncbi:MAG TPA: FHA domain-containing protein [Steroidobacteraceae bacterium]